MFMANGCLSDPLYVLPLVSLAWFLVGVVAGRRLAAPRRANVAGGRKEKSAGARKAGGRSERRGREAGRGDEIYIGNLSYDVTEQDLEKTVAQFGKVASVRLIKNKFNDKSKGYAFVRMVDQPTNDRVIKGLSGKEHEGRKLVVNMAKSKAR